MKIGFIGLGRMGQGMALNLQKSGVDLCVFDLNPAAVKTLTDAGAKSATSVAELASQVDVLFTSLPGPVQVEEVILGPQGVMAHMRRGLVLFELSTSSLSLARRIHAAFEERGAVMLDAPVSGGPAGAASGDLALWIGGDKAVFEQHLKLLRSIGDKASHVGPIGSGTVAKLSHNLLGYMFLGSMAEVFSMATKAGMDPLTLWKAMRSGVAGRSRGFDNIVYFLTNNHDPAHFALRLAQKDVNLALQLGRELDVPMRLCNALGQDMHEAMARGWGGRDAQAVLALQSERAGIEPIQIPEEVVRQVLQS